MFGFDDSTQVKVHGGVFEKDLTMLAVTEVSQSVDTGTRRRHATIPDNKTQEEGRCLDEEVIDGSNTTNGGES